MVRQSDIDDASLEKNRLKKEDKGIKWERSCTDCLCCFIFLAFIVAMVGLSGFALMKGDPAKMLTPYDSVGNACGMPAQCSTGVYAFPQNETCVTPFKIPGSTEEREMKIRDFTLYPYKYFPLTEFNSPTGMYNAVCVKACPAILYKAAEQKGACVISDNAIEASGSGETAVTAGGIVGAAPIEGTDFSVVAEKADLESCGKACIADTKCKAFQFLTLGDKTTKCMHFDKQPDVKGSAAGEEKCYIKEEGKMEEVDYMANDDVYGYGFNLDGMASVENKGVLYSAFPTKVQGGSVCLPTKEIGEEIFTKVMLELDKSTGFVKYVVELKDCWEILLGMAIATIFISIFYIFLLKWITKPLLYTSMLIILIGFILLGGWMWLKKADYDQELQKENYQYCFYGAIVSWVIGAVYLGFICCCWKNIALGASIMECASEFVAQNLRILWLPVTSYLVCVPFIAFWTVSVVHLYSMGTPEFKENSFFANIIWEDQTRYAIWFYLFGLLWVVAFIICLQQFMIAATVCQWYFSGQGEDMADSPYTTSVWRSFKWGIFYHVGSIAFGSFFIALITFIRIIFEYIIYQYEQVGNKENPVYKAVKCYIRYILWCLDSYVKCISKNAFIQIALHSNSFCSAAWASFWLIIRHCGRFTSANMIGWIMMMLGKGTIMGVSAYLTFLVIKEAAPDVQQPLVPTAIILLVSYMVGSMFLSVFSFACTALLHCFILDEDTGGSDLTPKALQGFLAMNDAKVEKDKKFKKVEGTGAEAEKANDMN